MAGRDNFSGVTKRILFDRAGNKCSFPSCRAPTSGPSERSPTSIDSTGMACHISGAAAGKGSKRYDPTISPDDRKSPNNGIWMCYKHGKQIDNDVVRFSSDMLRKWKKISETIACIEHDTGKTISSLHYSIVELGLADNTVEIPKEDVNTSQLIGDALKDSCISVIWGDDLNRYIRSFLIERTRNAFNHGGASTCKVEITNNKIIFIDDGDQFSHDDLLNHPSGRGGAITKRELMNKYGGKILSSYQRIGNKNRSIIAKINSVEDVAKITPCSITISARDKLDKDYNEQSFETCSKIYIALPDYFTISDQYGLSARLSKINIASKKVVFVLNDAPDYIDAHLQSIIPNAEVIRLQPNRY